MPSRDHCVSNALFQFMSVLPLTTVMINNVGSMHMLIPLMLRVATSLAFHIVSS